MILSCVNRKVFKTYLKEAVRCCTGKYFLILNNKKDFCNLDLVEDKKHFLFICPVYATLRNSWLNNMNLNLENFDMRMN